MIYIFTNDSIEYVNKSNWELIEPKNISTWLKKHKVSLSERYSNKITECDFHKLSNKRKGWIGNLYFTESADTMKSNINNNVFSEASFQ